jgi:tetratricopeptide (TPR) repeat protein
MATISQSDSTNPAGTKPDDKFTDTDSIHPNPEISSAKPITENQPKSPGLAQAKTPQTQVEHEKTWYQDANTLAAIGSIGAVIISVFALLASHRGQTAQQIREKREELRGVLEKLVSLREEQAIVNKVKDETEKAWSSGYLNTKRAIYLEAGESIAKQISKKVSPSEFYVLGFENLYDSDFIQAREYYRLAARRSRNSSSLPKQSEIWRSLAATYFIQDHALLDIDEGRKCFETSLRILEGRNDNYTRYVRTLSLRDWAQGELSCRNYSKTASLLHEGYNEWQNIPVWAGYQRGLELRHFANLWRMLGVGRCQEARPDGTLNMDEGREAFEKALELIQIVSNKLGVNDDSTIDAHGLIYQDWGQQERTAGSSV